MAERYLSAGSPDRYFVRIEDGVDGGGEAISEQQRSRPLIWLLRASGPVAAIVVWILLANAQDLDEQARVVAAVGTLMAIWWMAEAIPLAATSLLPIALFPTLAGLPVAEVTAPYANPIVFLFLGGFLLAIGLEKWNVHRRFALVVLRIIGTGPHSIILGMMLATGFLSMWVSNTATTLMMLPIGVSLISLVTDGLGENEEKSAHVEQFGVCMMLAIAWSASMGGLGTLLGSPPNAIIAAYALTELGIRIGFLDWMVIGVPTSFAFILIGWFLMTRVLYPFRLDGPSDGHDTLDQEIAALGPVRRGEKMALGAFAAAAFFWIVPGLAAGIIAMPAWLTAIDDAVIAIAAALSLFLLPANADGDAVLNWKDAEESLPWGVLLLFGGGLSLASAVSATGLDGWMGSFVGDMAALPVVLLIAAIVALVIFLTEVTSNTATAATFIPILGAVAIAMDMDPMSLLVPAALAATCAFMLPVGTPPNAIVFSTGRVGIKQMARGGVILNLVGVVLITLACYLLGDAAMGLRY